MNKQIPVTTQAKCDQYKTQPGFCMCDDFRINKGGSYVLQGIQVCKHIAFLVEDQALVPNPDYDPFYAFNQTQGKYSCEWMPSIVTEWIGA